MALRPPEKITLLSNAYTAELSGTQRHFVAHPVTSGPQACLIEVTNSKNYTIEIVDALIVVPGEVASGTDALPDPLYACWLGVIRNFYKTDRDRLLKSPTIQALSEKAETEHPFRPTRQSELFENATQLLKEWSIVPGSAPPQIAAQTWLAFTTSVARAEVWYT